MCVDRKLFWTAFVLVALIGTCSPLKCKWCMKGEANCVDKECPTKSGEVSTCGAFQNGDKLIGKGCFAKAAMVFYGGVTDGNDTCKEIEGVITKVIYAGEQLNPEPGPLTGSLLNTDAIKVDPDLSADELEKFKKAMTSLGDEGSKFFNAEIEVNKEVKEKTIKIKRMIISLTPEQLTKTKTAMKAALDQANGIDATQKYKVCTCSTDGCEVGVGGGGGDDDDEDKNRPTGPGGGGGKKKPTGGGVSGGGGSGAMGTGPVQVHIHIYKSGSTTAKLGFFGIGTALASTVFIL